MYDAALDWASKNTKASLKMIRFVMYSKDTEAQQVCIQCHTANIYTIFESDGLKINVFAIQSRDHRFQLYTDHLPILVSLSSSVVLLTAFILSVDSYSVILL